MDLTPLAAGLAIGLGGIGPGIGLGIGFSKAMEAIGIYALVVSLIILFT
ncbi:MAG: hypothetical protein M3P32_00910 [Chloroflexota bacterium]|nr:hypothetical protein [Chloroflexota bacterium]